MADLPSPSSGAPRPDAEIVDLLRGRGPALVALSGGVDSAAAASLAHRALGDRALAATVVSRSVSPRELDAARAAARSVGLRHLLVRAEPLDDPRYRENEADRCYRCRTVETTALREAGASEGAVQYLDGVHRDDLADDRPGLRAMDEAGFFHPLLWAGWGKADVRRYARSVGLPNWDRPSNACLASRVARREPLTPELLERIDRAEGVLLDRGFRRVRVRVRGDVASVEVGADETARLAAGALRADLTASLVALGFRTVAFDPVGYRSREQLPVVR
jgi:pyridinium-3,5-biscarboxylic acid mononucleotide sulfurtransferase